MEPLAFVEVLDRHRDVVARHPVYRWPAKVGRSYDADVILDDPFVAPVHVQIDALADGRFNITDAGSVNGVFVGASRVDRGEAGADDIVRVGHTHLRIRTRTHPVPEERPLEITALYRRPYVFALAVATACAVFLWNGWIVTADEEEKYTLLFPALGFAAILGTWIAVWSFVSNALGRRSNFFAHGTIACAGIVTILAVESLLDYAAFGLDWSWLDTVAAVAGGALLGYMIYRHLLLNSRATRKALAITAAVIAVTIYGGTAALDMLMDLAQGGEQQYHDSIKTPAVLAAPGVTPDAFMERVGALKPKVDALAKRK